MLTTQYCTRLLHERLGKPDARVSRVEASR